MHVELSRAVEGHSQLKKLQTYPARIQLQKVMWLHYIQLLLIFIILLTL